MDDRQWLEERLHRLETRFREDAQAMEARLTAQIVDLREATTARLNDHSNRLRALENWRSWTAGIAAAAGGAAGFVAQLFGFKGGGSS